MCIDESITSAAYGQSDQVLFGSEQPTILFGSKQQPEPEQVVFVPEEAPDILFGDDDGPRAQGASSGPSGWACGACTLENADSVLACTACNTVRPNPAAPSGIEQALQLAPAQRTQVDRLWRDGKNSLLEKTLKQMGASYTAYRASPLPAASNYLQCLVLVLGIGF